MNKNEEEKIDRAVSSIVNYYKHSIYEMVNEFIFDEELAEESDDKKYQEIYRKIYDKVMWRLIKPDRIQ